MLVVLASIFPLFMESNVLEKSSNNSVDIFYMHSFEG